ncbi:hypothetical protein [Leifsonia sp. RAF41]|uniref:hypothetical protein n=1 Tax=Leifsonia sp. RAF41 TaxID=3233056 RepID=UPI003F9E7BFA
MDHPNKPNHEPNLGPDRSLLTREQEQYAARQIERGIEAAAWAATPIDPMTARLIAATLHPGYGSHLKQFAATGSLNPSMALQEIGGAAALYQLPWITALWDFLEQIDSPDPDRAPSEWEEPTPAVFVQAKDPQLGLLPVGMWVTPDSTGTAVAEAVADVAQRLETPGAIAGITASVGFYRAPVSFDADPEVVSANALGILKHGEPYALLAERVGHPITDEGFLEAYLGAYSSLTAFMAAQGEDVLQEVRRDTRSPAADPSESFDRFERLLRRTFHCLDGRHAVYVFQRTPALTTEAL